MQYRFPHKYFCLLKETCILMSKFLKEKEKQQNTCWHLRKSKKKINPAFTKKYEYFLWDVLEANATNKGFEKNALKVLHVVYTQYENHAMYV